MISVLIPAAGQGLRLGGDAVKALVPIAGRPMLLWSLEALREIPDVVEVVVAAPSDAFERFESLRAEVGWEQTIVGGATRSESVLRLISVARGRRVMVHDAARPCVPGLWAASLVRELGDDPAGVPALPVRDTLKRGRDGMVVETLDRDDLYSIQTPQIFDADVLRRAHAEAQARGATATDDAALVEAIGVPVRLLRGEPSNLKVTYPDDVALASQILRARTGSAGGVD